MGESEILKAPIRKSYGPELLCDFRSSHHLAYPGA